MNSSVQPAKSQSPALTCWLQAWVVAWALIVCISAVIEAVLRGGVTAYGVFQIADAVPPMAKIALGILAAGAFYIVRGRGTVIAAVAGATAFAGAILLPVGYFAADTLSPLTTFVHLLAGAIGGLVFSFLHDRCNARKAGQT